MNIIVGVFAISRNRGESMQLQFSYISFAFIFVTTLLFNLTGCSKKEQTPSVAPVQSKQETSVASGVLSTFGDDERPHTSSADQKHGSAAGAKKQADKKQPDYFHVELNKQGRGVAYIAKVGDKVRVVFNGKPDKFYRDIDSSTLSISSDGQHVGYAASNDSSQGAGSGSGSGAKWMLVHDGKEEGPFDSLGPPVFSPDGQHLAFECKKGERWKMCVDSKPYGDAFSYIDKPAFSKDSRLIVFGETAEAGRNPRIVISDLEFKEQRVIDQSGGPVAINADLSRVAAIKDAGKKKQVVEFDFSLSGKLKEGSLYDEVRNLVFSADGKVLAYLGKKGKSTYLVLDGKDDQLSDGEYPWPPVIKPDNKGAGIAIVGKDGAYLYQAFGSGGPSQNRYKEIADVVFSNDARNHAYVAIKDERFLIVVNGKEGPFYDRVITPQFSPDGKFMIYRARKDNKRFVVVADTTGKVIKEQPGYDRVFETIFTQDGASVAYGVIDGNKIMWKVEKL